MEGKNLTYFMQSLNTVFESFSDWKLLYGEIMEGNRSIEVPELSVAVGITGDFTGYVYLSVDCEVSKKITSQMLGGMEVDEIDELVISAIGELGNMMMGNTCAQISSDGYEVDITPPSIIKGKEIVFSSDVTIYRIPASILHVGGIQLDVVIKAA